MKKDSAILFFHGYGSSPETDKFTKIPFTNKFAIKLNYDEGLKVNLEKAREFVKLYSERYDEIILIGHSMGGYVANEMSAEFGYPAILISPCLLPKLSRPEIVDIDTDFKISKVPVIVLIENDDEVFDIPKYKEFTATLPDNYSITYFDGGHHRINRITDIHEAIVKISKKFYPDFI